MQSADSSLGLSWWLLYQMPGKLQGFKTFRTTSLQLDPTTLLPLLTSSSFIHGGAASRKPLSPSQGENGDHPEAKRRLAGRSRGICISFYSNLIRIQNSYATLASSYCSASASVSTGPS
jgi:hypothetical protein